ncbi:AAA family ATPase [Candidatus Pacearchaeota archaeon]|nr:AAA family ATPase [Candidatus Pacearchaeota archaeon]
MGDNPGFLSTYLPGVDELLGDGIPLGSSVLIEGGPGSGKTIFCISLAKTLCERGKKVLYMSFEEPEVRLRSHFRSFGARIEEYERNGLFYVKRFNALDIARSVEALLSEAKRELLVDVQPVLIPPDFDPEIVLIDSLSSISSAFSGEESRFRVYMEQLFRYLESHKMTSFLIREVANPTHVGNMFVEPGEAVSFLSDGIIVLYNVFFQDNPRKRAIEVLKMRGSQIDRKIVECEIRKGIGIVAYPNKILKGPYTLT